MLQYTAWNLPLPPCKHVVQLSHSNWNQVVTRSGINMQLIENMNFFVTVYSPQCAFIKNIILLQSQYAIHSLSQTISCTRDVVLVSGAIVYRKHLRCNKALWKTTRSIEVDRLVMSQQYNLVRMLVPTVVSTVCISRSLHCRICEMILSGSGIAPMQKLRVREWYKHMFFRLLPQCAGHVIAVWLGCWWLGQCGVPRHPGSYRARGITRRATRTMPTLFKTSYCYISQHLKT